MKPKAVKGRNGPNDKGGGTTTRVLPKPSKSK